MLPYLLKVPMALLSCRTVLSLRRASFIHTFVRHMYKKSKPGLDLHLIAVPAATEGCQ
jgi:hypothetical protein